MRRFAPYGMALVLGGTGLACVRAAAGGPAAAPRALAPTAAPGGGAVIEHDSLVSVREPGPHAGGGETTAYPFFAGAEGLALVFRKRALHPGAAIGYHWNGADEIYYVLSGRGELTVDGARREVGPGTAILTRPGSSHGLRQVGADDLVILVSYVRVGER